MIKSTFTKNILTLLTGTTIAQAIPILISPILTRLYSPNDFGVFALFSVIVTTIATIANGRYELAVMLPKKDEDAINLFALSLIINFSISLVLFFLVLIFHNKILALINSNEISFWLYIAPFSIFLLGLYNLLSLFNNRKKYYKDLAKANVYKSIAMAIVQLIFGFLKAGSSGLISGQILSYFVSNTKLFFNIKKLNLFSKIKKIKLIALAKRYKKFPIYNLPNALIDGFRMSLINILIGKFFLLSTLGQFSLAWRMVQVPSSIIGGAVSQVFFQKVATSKKSELKYIALNFIKKASLLAMPMFLIIFFFSKEIFSFIFGKEWEVAGEVASILSPWLFLNFLTSPLSTIFIKLEKQQILLIFGIFYAIIPVFILYFFNSSFLEAIKYISFAMSLMLIFFIFLLFFILQKVR